MYAIIQTGGKQYRVEPGDVLQVEKLKGEPGETLELPAVAVATDGEPIRAGKNLSARVQASILDTGPSAPRRCWSSSSSGGSTSSG